MEPKQYRKFWTAMVFSASFATGLAFLGALLIHDKVVTQVVTKTALETAVDSILSMPTDILSGRTTR